MGNVIFIGELFRKKLISEKIIFLCLSSLLNSVFNLAKDNTNPPIEDVEGLCKLLCIVGKDIDAAGGDPKKKMTMDSSFAKLKQVVANKHLSSRVRFMIQDVVEFRMRNWMPLVMR